MSEFVDESTGELLEIPEGEDRLFWAAQHLREAKDQIKAWEQRAGACSALLLAEQDDKRAVYGDVSVSVRQNMRKVFDVAAFRDYIADAELNLFQLQALVFSATGFDAKTLNGDALGSVILQCTSEQPTRAFVVVERVRKLAPVRQVPA